jgi:hypothetical protein
LRCAFQIAAALIAAFMATAAPRAAESRLTDSDGWLDMSRFLDTAYGFVPIIMPITEPAVGYGALGALVFIDRHAPGSQGLYARPNIAAVGGLRTENGTQGVFGSHLGTWLDGKVRTQVALADFDVNLDFFGLGGNRTPGEVGLGYSIAARGGVAGASYRIGESPLWLGARYTRVNTGVTLDAPATGLPGVPASDFDLELGGLTPALTLDMRDNFFTPTRGWYVDLSVPIFRKGLGGDRDFEKLDLTAIHFRPLGDSVFFSVRGTAKASSGGTPFYLRPYVSLRGVQALRYQGERAAEVEGELRWQAHPRFSVVGFAGTGVARGGTAIGDGDKTVVAAGAGVRYLLARKHGLHFGLDVAAGPDDKPIFYLVFGNAWLRP